MNKKNFSSSEGDILEQFQYPLTLQDEGQVHIIFPVIICHVIDDNSPLYTLSASQLLTKRWENTKQIEKNWDWIAFTKLDLIAIHWNRFEIIVTFTGASASTGQTTEERTSYLSNEIMWGHRFVNIVEYDTENCEYFIDYAEFETTEEVRKFFILK